MEKENTDDFKAGEKLHLLPYHSGISSRERERNGLYLYIYSIYTHVYTYSLAYVLVWATSSSLLIFIRNLHE